MQVARLSSLSLVAACLGQAHAPVPVAVGCDWFRLSTEPASDLELASVRNVCNRPSLMDWFRFSVQPDPKHDLIGRLSEKEAKKSKIFYIEK